VAAGTAALAFIGRNWERTFLGKGGVVPGLAQPGRMEMASVYVDEPYS
jgi:hypothetical protein